MMLSTSFATLLSLVTLVPHLASAAPTHRRQEDPQVSLTLDPDVIQPGLAFDGQGDNPAEGQVPSLTSVNNFINFCLTQADVPLTNGEQIDGGSCNPAPIGRIAAFDRLPASKFTNPPNFSDNLVEGEPFVVEMRINNLATGQFTNPNTNYYSAPQQVDGDGVILGHSHVTIQEIGDLAATAPADPTIFAFFKGFNDAAIDGVLTADVTEGLPAGVYRMCSINTGANHAPVIVSNAQHGSLDDCTYFTVRAAGEEQAEVIEEVPVEEVVEEEAEVIVEEPPVAEEIEVPPEVIEEAPVLEEEEIAQDPAAVAAVEAQSLNASYTSIQAGDACQAGDQVCTANGQFAQCVGGQLVALACPGGTTCLASPRNVGSTQIDVTCTTENVVADIIAAAGVTGGIRG